MSSFSPQTDRDEGAAATVEVWRYVYAASLGLMVLSAVALTGYAIWLVAT